MRTFGTIRAPAYSIFLSISIETHHNILFRLLHLLYGLPEGTSWNLAHLHRRFSLPVDVWAEDLAAKPNKPRVYL